jgi:beta-N-acetylhexosaminidase
VDHEGGRVQRFKTDGFTSVPAMRDLGELWMKDAMRACDAAAACGFILASELRACGVDLTFAPVLDLDWGPSGVIGNRSFHSDARVVTMLARSVIHGLLSAGMQHCGKHFPGHGYIAADSHHAIPVDKRSLKAILKDDAAPFAWMSATLASVMPAHVIYPKVDTRPAGFSKVWLQDILRGQLGFTGCVFSDDLSMAAARLIDGKQVSYTEAALAALHAGGDMVLLCNQSTDGGQAVDDLLHGLSNAIDAGELSLNEASALRRNAMLPISAPLAWDDLMHDAKYMQALSLLP